MYRIVNLLVSSILILILVWLAATAFGGLLLMWAWNLLMPVFWSAAPHFTLWMGMAGALLIQIVGGLFRHTGGSK